MTMSTHCSGPDFSCYFLIQSTAPKLCILYTDDSGMVELVTKDGLAVRCPHCVKCFKGPPCKILNETPPQPLG